MHCCNGPMPRLLRLAACLLLAAGIVPPAACGSAPPCHAAGLLLVAQLPPPGMMAGNASPDPDVFPRPERTLVRQLTSANELVQQRRWGEAVRCLDVILRSPEDYLYQPDEKEPLHRSLRSEANRILGSLPPEGRQWYELQYGSQARQLLNRAVATRDRDLLDEVSRRWFHTAAGYEATFLLGLSGLDRGEPLAAALTLEQLRDEATSVDRFEPVLSLALAACWRQSGCAEKAQAVLSELRDRQGPPALVAGRQQSFAGADADLLASLLASAEVAPASADTTQSPWTQPRANAARTAAVRASRPLLEPIWKIPIAEHPMAASILAVQSQYCAQRSIPLLPSLQPLALDNVVLMRSLRTLAAIDGRTGKRLWEAPADDVLDESPDAYRALFPQPGQLASLLCQRAWQDGVYGALSSDGRRVFAVEDLGLSLSSRGRRVMVQGGRPVAGTIWPKSYNRLAAYDVRTGKLVWHLGGSRDEYGLDLAGAFFLGSPLPMADRLYQLAEMSGEIHLVAIEAPSGRVLWSQRIAVVDQNILQSPLRRLVALSPSYRDGIVVCPTADGAIVGVKLARRSLLWGYRYARSAAARNAQMPFAVFSVPTIGQSQWTDASLVLAGDRVLATPPDSEEIHCLDLVDGRLVWKKPREDGLYLAAVRGKTVVVVGPTRVRALSLADGSPQWNGRTIELPEGSAASGQGFRSGELYYLPVSSGEVAVLDLDAGKIRQTLRSPSAVAPGNLVCYRDKVISQGIEAVAAFDQIDPLGERIARRLAKDPDDAEALRRKGQILLAEDKRAEAVDCLRRSFRLAPGPECRRQLREALLDGLRHEFARYQSAGVEIESLLDSPAQRIEYLCLMAMGLQSQSAWKPALAHYMRLADACGDAREMVQIERSHLVRVDRWLAARLADFRRAAPAEEAGELDRWLQQRLEAARLAKTTDPLARFACCFDGQPQADQAQRELVGRYLASGQLLKAEMLLRRQMRSAADVEAAAMVLQLADVFQKAGRTKDAAACYRELEERWPEVVCRDGKTGRQLVASLPAGGPIAAAVHPERLWPVGAVRVSTATHGRAEQLGRGAVPLPFHGDRRPFFAHHVAAVDQNGHELLLLDGHGREQWRLLIPGIDQYYYYSQRYAPRLCARGHLLLLSLGYRSMAIDAVAGSRDRVLWQEDIMTPVTSATGAAGLAVQRLGAPWGPRIFISSVSDLDYRAEAFAPDAFTEDYVCYHRFRRCVAMDSLAGKTLWSRSDLPPQCTIFGDASRVFLVPGDRTAAIVLSAGDGRRLPERPVLPPRHEWLATLGSGILRWHSEGGKLRLELFDAWTQKTLWGPHSFSPGARHCLLDNQSLAVMEPDGRFVLFTLPDGRKQIDTRLEPEPMLDGIVLFDSGAGYVLVTSDRPAPIADPNRWRQLYGAASKMIYKGRVYAFDRSGRRLWPDRPKGVEIENQQLLLRQPAWLPVLTFAAQSYRPGDRGIQWVTSVLMIDKRDGRTLVDQDYQDRVAQVVLAGDPDTRTVTFAMQQRSLLLTFTDEPAPPSEQPATQSSVDKRAAGAKEPGVVDTMFRIMKKVSGR